MNRQGTGAIQTLGDLGEFKLLREVVLPILRQNDDVVSPLGDDCAFVALPSGDRDLVVTTDVGPRPLAWHLGHESYRTWGWYTVIVNASDLASAGATPLVITTSLDCAIDMALDDFREFFEGVAEASGVHGLANAGGNIRQAPRFASHATVVGLVPRSRRVGRAGARPGDLLVSIGACGRFASAFLRAKKNGFDFISTEDHQTLCRPCAYVNEMKLLCESQLISAASDASDGVLGALWNIAEASDCGIRLNMSPNQLPAGVARIAEEYGYDPWNLMFFWGDWQVVVAVPEAKGEEFNRTTRDHGITTQILGRATRPPSRLIGTIDGCDRPLRLLRNQNFAQSSFNNDPLSNVDYMLATSLAM